MSDKTYLDREDYEEPRCVLCMDAHKKDEEKVTRIDAGRMLKKLDEYFSYNDYESAERHLKFWLTEAQFGHDKEGELLIRNEQMGLFRKIGKKEEAYASLERAVSLLDEIGLEGTEIYGTTFLNAATVLKTFSESEKALEYYKKAEKAYEKRLEKDDAKFAGLYNNMGLALADLKRFDEAMDCYNRAKDIMSKIPGGKLDEAITYLNMADLYRERDGFDGGAESIAECVDRAQELIDDESLERNGYYAFVCEKCAPSFLYYGYFAFAEELKERAKSIYERA